MYQAVSVVLLLAPMFVVALNGRPGIQPLEWVGAFVWLIGLSGEAVSDAQMSTFRAKPENKGKVCEDGLWYYSRHPNYFFESVIWLGYGIFALASPYGWITLYAPALIWFLLLKVTGIPFAEETSIRTRGDLYRDYQRRTSAFIPLPKRK
jgi:steroid 5-alpha reductase family enzyme